jgi:hypothetical protein
MVIPNTIEAQRNAAIQQYNTAAVLGVTVLGVTVIDISGIVTEGAGVWPICTRSTTRTRTTAC